MNTKKGFAVWVLVCAILIAVGIGVFMWKKQSQAKAEKKKNIFRCIRNCHNIAGAIVQYNKERKEKFGDKFLMTKLDLLLLQKSVTNFSIPVCPGKGEYLIEGDVKGVAQIVCSFHGSLDNMVLGL